MTEEQLIDGIFAREGDEYGDQTTDPPIDQPTGRGGITLATMRAYLGRPATIEDLKALTHDDARRIVQWVIDNLVRTYQLDAIAFEPLRVQLIDFAYNSSAALAIRWLQRCLQVPRTSIMDGPTRLALQDAPPFLLNQALIAARLEMITRSVDSHRIAERFDEGLEHRALSFSLLQVP